MLPMIYTRARLFTAYHPSDGYSISVPQVTPHPGPLGLPIYTYAMLGTEANLAKGSEYWSCEKSMGGPRSAGTGTPPRWTSDKIVSHHVGGWLTTATHQRRRRSTGIVAEM